LALYWRNEI